MPVYFNVPFNPQEGVTQQILQGLHQGFSENLQNQQLSLEKQRTQSETSRSSMLDQLTQAQIAHETLSTQIEKENDPVKKHQLMLQNSEAAMRAAQLRHNLGFVGLHFDEQGNETPAPSGTGTAGQPPDVTETDPGVKALEQQLGPFSKDESAMWEGGKTNYARTGDLSNVISAAKDVTSRRIAALGEPIPADRKDQENASNLATYRIMNPNATALPSYLTLGPNATQKDSDRIGKNLDFAERLMNTKSQQDTTNAIREQTLALSQGKQDITPVIGQDPKTGKDVLVSKDEADKLGLTGTMKAEAADVSKSQAARHWLPLAENNVKIERSDPKDAKSAPANSDKMGILQLVDDLDKRGQLGAVASRWNDFLAGKFGAGDPEIEALRVKMGLSTTLLMNVHLGQRGGQTMLEHFKELADEGKMDAATLRSGVRSELDYVRARAMMPEASAGEATQSQATAPTSQTHQFSTSAWKRANPQGDENAAKAAAQGQGYTVVP